MLKKLPTVAATICFRSYGVASPAWSDEAEHDVGGLCELNHV